MVISVKQIMSRKKEMEFYETIQKKVNSLQKFNLKFKHDQKLDSVKDVFRFKDASGDDGQCTINFTVIRGVSSRGNIYFKKWPRENNAITMYLLYNRDANYSLLLKDGPVVAGDNFINEYEATSRTKKKTKTGVVIAVPDFGIDLISKTICNMKHAGDSIYLKRNFSINDAGINVKGNGKRKYKLSGPTPSRLFRTPFTVAVKYTVNGVSEWFYNIVSYPKRSYFDLTR